MKFDTPDVPAVFRDFPAYEPFPAHLPFDRFRASGDLIFVSGHIPDAGGPTIYRGIVGDDVSLEDATAAARQACRAVISALSGAIEHLDRVVAVIRMTGYVASAPGFGDQPLVVNGASELLIEAFGPTVGRHARSAIGVASLPARAPVEIEAIFQVDWR
ncbi:MAG: RidA family protein [Lacisediminihabitans sp.]